MDRVERSIDIARRVASGEWSRERGATEILNFVHEEADRASNAMADAIMRAWRATEAA